MIITDITDINVLRKHGDCCAVGDDLKVHASENHHGKEKIRLFVSHRNHSYMLTTKFGISWTHFQELSNDLILKGRQSN